MASVYILVDEILVVYAGQAPLHIHLPSHEDDLPALLDDSENIIYDFTRHLQLFRKLRKIIPRRRRNF